MARLQLSTPDAGDIAYVAQHMRTQDVHELRAMWGCDLDVHAVLRQSVRSSQECWVAITPYGEPVAIFGLAPVSLLGGLACPWMLGTPSLEHYGRDVVLFGKRYARQWTLQYDQLFNYVDARNLRAIAWLRHSGYTVFAAEPRGLNGEPFHRFERCA